MTRSLMAEVSIRRARAGDEEALALVGQATFLETFAGELDGGAIVEHCLRAHSSAHYSRWLDDHNSAVWIAEVVPGKAPVGYMVVAPPDLPGADVANDLELKRLYLLSRYQRGGTGRRLLALAVEHATSVATNRLLLGVYAANDSAIAFYRRHGFVNLTDRKFNVGGRAYDDHVMSLTLKE